MGSKISFFNKGIYKKTCKRFFPWSICYGLILLVILPAMSGIIYNNRAVYSSDGTTYRNTLTGLTGELVEYTASLMPFLIVIIAFAAMFAGMLIFSYLFKERAANMMHALPVSREALLITSLLAGLTLLLLPMVLAEGITVLLGLLFGITYYALLHAKLLLAFCLITFVFFSIAVFCAILSGHVITMPVLFQIVNFVSLWCWLLGGLMKELFVFGCSMSSELSTAAKYLSPIIMLGSEFAVTEYPDALAASDLYTGTVICRLNFQMVIIYTLCAVLLLAVSLLLYRKRKVECAGDILAFKGTAWIFQILLATGTGVLFTILLYSFFDYDIVRMPYLSMLFFLLGTPFGFFAGRMLIRKNFFIFRESAKGFVIFAVCALLLMLSVKMDLYGEARRVPDPEDVESVTIDFYDSSVQDKDAINEMIDLHKQIVENRAMLEKRRVKNPDAYEEWDHISIRYRLKNGGLLDRNYEIPYNEKELSDSSSLIARIKAVSSSPVFTKAYYLTEDFVPEDLTNVTFYNQSWQDMDAAEDSADGETSEDIFNESYYVELSREEEITIGEAILKDIEEGHLKRQYAGDAPFSYDQYLQYEIKLDNPSELYRRNYKYESITINEDMNYTIQALTDMGYISDEHPLTVNSDPMVGYEKDPESEVISPDPVTPDPQPAAISVP